MSGERLVAIIRESGGLVLKTIRKNKPLEFTTANGRWLWPYAVERLISDGRLVPADNGLFDHPTTYRLTDSSP